MNLETMKQKKRELGYSNERIAELSGVPLSTVQKIFSGITEHPRYETLAALEKVFGYTSASAHEAVLQYDAEGHSIHKKQGEYTIEDYELFPEDWRVELIDGVIYDLSGPLVIHQMLVGALYRILHEHIKKNKGNCISIMAPFDVHLLKDDDKTIVQPDVFVVCDRDKFTRRRLEGAPDFAIEVISPSTKRKDFILKLKKYSDAHVREYWLVDPETRNVTVYLLEDIIVPKTYTFDDKIPVTVLDGGCIIDMAEISQELEFFYGLED